MRKPSDLREKRAGIDTHSNLYIFMKIPNQFDVRNVGNVKMHSFEDTKIVLERVRVEEMRLFSLLIFLDFVGEEGRKRKGVDIALILKELSGDGGHCLCYLFKIIKLFDK